MKLSNCKHLVMFARSNSLVDKEGYLWKKGEFNTSYQKRWFILKGNLLFYYEKRNEPEPVGVIVLEDCFVQLAEGGDSPFTFSIHFTGEGTRVYKLTADDEESCNSWMKALTTCTYGYMQILVDNLKVEMKKLRENNSKIIHSDFDNRSIYVTSSCCDLSSNQFPKPTYKDSMALLATTAAKSSKNLIKKLSPKTPRKNMKRKEIIFEKLHEEITREIFNKCN